MSEPKFVKIARVGDTAKEVVVTSDMTVSQAIEAAGYDVNDNMTVYGSAETGGNRVVSMNDNVNGYTKIAISTNVKGGC